MKYYFSSMDVGIIVKIMLKYHIPLYINCFNFVFFDYYACIRTSIYMTSFLAAKIYNMHNRILTRYIDLSLFYFLEKSIELFLID